jgi:hypothetical protein
VLGRSASPQACSAIVTQVPTEPQDAYGAATRGWPLRTQIKSAQATDGRLRQDPESGAKQHIRSEDNLVDEHKGTSYGLGEEPPPTAG